MLPVPPGVRYCVAKTERRQRAGVTGAGAVCGHGTCGMGEICSRTELFERRCSTHFPWEITRTRAIASDLAKVGVASSSLVSRSKFNKLCDSVAWLQRYPKTSIFN
jgi:hypothetical protein